MKNCVYLFLILFFSCRNTISTDSVYNNKESVEIVLDSITIKDPTTIVDFSKHGKLCDIFSINNEIIWVLGTVDDSVFIIKDNNAILKLKFPEKLHQINNAPYVTIKDSILYFLIQSNGNLYAINIFKDSVITKKDNIYKSKGFNDLGLSISFYPFDNTFNKQIKVFNDELFFLTMPSGYNDSLNNINGKYSTKTTDAGYPLVAKYNFKSKEIDTLPIRAPIIPSFLKAGILNDFYLCFTDSLIIATAPAFNSFITYNLNGNSIESKILLSDFHKERDVLKEEDDLISYYFMQPYFGQLIFNSNNKYFSQIYNIKQNRKVDKVKNFFLREKSMIFYDNQLNKIKEIIVPDSLSGFHKFAHKNAFYYSKLPNNDTLITFYRFSIVES